MVAVAIGLVLALLATIVVTYRRRHAPEAIVPRFTMPATVTPLSALALLRRIEEDPTALDSENRAILRDEVRELERRYFAAGPVQPPDETKRGFPTPIRV